MKKLVNRIRTTWERADLDERPALNLQPQRVEDLVFTARVPRG